MSAGGAKADVRKYNVSTLINKVATNIVCFTLTRAEAKNRSRGDCNFNKRYSVQKCSQPQKKTAPLPCASQQYRMYARHVTPVKDCIQVVVTSNCKSEQLYLSQQASKAFQKTKRWRLTDTQSSYLPHNFHQHQFVSCCALLFQHG